MKTLMICIALFSLAPAGAYAEEHASGKEPHHPHWGYKGEAGPKHWGDLEHDFVACKLGTQQSPVDIRKAQDGQLPAIGLNYTVSAAEIVNNGHSIQVNVADAGSVKLMSGDFKLVQFHFHAPSEERIHGKSFPFNAHFVHRNEEGKLAVIAVLFKQSKEDNPALARIFEAMPTEVGGKVELKDGINPVDFFPSRQDYYAYTGSLTTPPCSEDVQWQVLKTPVPISRAQLKAFTKLYPMNARPVQPLNGRVVKGS